MLKDLRLVDHLIAYATAIGASLEEISEAIRLPADHVRLKLTDERTREKVSKLQELLAEKKDPQVTTREKLEAMRAAALEVFGKAVEDESQKMHVRLGAAEHILDRLDGKPTQRVEHEGSLIRAMLERLHQVPQANDAIPVEFNEVKSDNENPNELLPAKTFNPNTTEDPIDSWAKKNLN